MQRESNGAAAHAVWLYLGSEARTAEERTAFVAWCRAKAVGRVLVHLSWLPLLKDETAAQVEALIAACSRAGIEVHGMFSALIQRTPDPSELLFQDKSCYCVDAHGISSWDEPVAGRAYAFDPFKPQVRSVILEQCRGMLQRFPGLAGIHLDFIRYFFYESRLTLDTQSAGHWITSPRPGDPIRFELPNGSKTTYFVEDIRNAYNDPPIGDRLVLKREHRFCYCPDCLKGFEAKFGLQLPVPLDSASEAASWLLQNHQQEWAEFRASVITELVREIRGAVSGVRADAQLSSTVWYNAPYGNELRGEPFRPDSVYEHFGQKWEDWAREGLIDFVCPMDYWLTPESFSEVVDDQIAKASSGGRRIPVYPGILRSGDFPFDEEQAEEYRRRAGQAGAAGVCYFHYGTWKTLSEANTPPSREGDST